MYFENGTETVGTHLGRYSTNKQTGRTVTTELSRGEILIQKLFGVLRENEDKNSEL